MCNLEPRPGSKNGASHFCIFCCWTWSSCHWPRCTELEAKEEEEKQVNYWNNRVNSLRTNVESIECFHQHGLWWACRTVCQASFQDRPPTQQQFLQGVKKLEDPIQVCIEYSEMFNKRKKNIILIKVSHFIYKHVLVSYLRCLQCNI